MNRGYYPEEQLNSHISNIERLKGLKKRDFYIEKIVALKKKMLRRQKVVSKESDFSYKKLFKMKDDEEKPFEELFNKIED